MEIPPVLVDCRHGCREVLILVLAAPGYKRRDWRYGAGETEPRPQRKMEWEAMAEPAVQGWSELQQAVRAQLRLAQCFARFASNSTSSYRRVIYGGTGRKRRCLQEAGTELEILAERRCRGGGGRVGLIFLGQ